MSEDPFDELLNPPTLWQYLANFQWRKHALSICAVAAIVGAGLSFFVRSDSGGDIVVPASMRPTSTTVSSKIVVDVGGAVLSPGVFTLSKGARVVDALEKAGGVSAESDVSQLNRAALVNDGDRIYVPKVGEVAPVASSGASTGSQLVDINIATAEQLDGLPGVGPATAQAIISYRTDHGRFASVDDLQNVSGIGPAKFAKLKDLVRT